MNLSPPPLSPCSSTQHTSSPYIPTLPHSIVAAAHCLAPLDDLHLAHLINELKPPAPVWSFYDQQHNPAHPTPVITSNDRLRSDELADLPAPEAERLHAAYDIEDYLDATPDRLLVYGPSTPILEILQQVKEILTRKNNASTSNNPIVYVARVSFQPNDGPDKSYKWEKGGPDLIRFELDPNQTLLPQNQLPITINWSPVELALSQALEVGHQLLALLHSRQFSEILSTLDVLHEFRPINPIVWLVDPVEYAHAQLRETTEWGWSEHHVELNSHHDHQSLISSNSADHPNSNPTIFGSTPLSVKDYAHSRPLSKSHLSHELYLIDEDQQQQSDSNQPSDHKYSAHPTSASTTPSCSKYPQSKVSKNLAEDLPLWLNDLLDRRLPRLLSLPDGCFSYELLNSSHPSHPSSQHIPCNVAPRSIPSTIASPPGKINSISPDGQSTSIKIVTNPKWTNLSVLETPTRAIILEQRSVANSVPSFDQHHLLSPTVTNSLRHVQTNTLKYYPCKACSEHAFKLALSHKLNEEKRRLLVGAGMSNSSNKSNSLSFQVHSNNRRGSNNINLVGVDGHERSASGEMILEGELASGTSPSGITGSNGSLHATQSTLSPPSNNNSKTSNANHRGQDLLYQNSAADNSKVADDHPHRAPPTPAYPVLGLGSKGKAIKEAMDREHDEFINHQKSVSLVLGLKSHHDGLLNPSSRHTSWDEGEVVED